MSPETIARIENSFARLAPDASALTAHFYGALFAAAPSVRALFPAELDEQEKKLGDSLALVVNHLRSLHLLTEPLGALGRPHLAYGATPAHYGVVRDTLVQVMAQRAEGWWTQELTEDWTNALNVVAGAMLSGASTRPGESSLA